MPFKVKLVVIFIIGIACAISYIHSQYLALLDIKPQNILLTESGFPKLADFGSATYFKKLDGTCRKKQPYSNYKLCGMQNLKKTKSLSL